MMPVAKVTALTQVTDPSCEMDRVIGLATEGEGWSMAWGLWLAGCLAEARAPADRDSGESIDLIGWQAGRH